MKIRAEDQETKHQLAAGTKSSIADIEETVVIQITQLSVGCNDIFYKTIALFHTGRSKTSITEDLASC